MRGVLWRAAAIAVAAALSLVLAACTRDESPGSGASPSAAAAAGGSANGGSGAVGVGPGTGSPQETLAPSELAAKASGSPEQQHCVQARLQADPVLAAALGTDPSASSRAEDFGRLVTVCGQASLAERFATNLAASVEGGVSDAQLTCLRDGYAALSPEALGSIVQAGLNPDVAGPASPTSPGPMNELLSRCGVDPSTVKVGL